MPQANKRPQAEIDTAVATLTDLLTRRYRGAHDEVNVVDFITLDEIKRLYRLTGLGEPANQAIEQAQRIARAGGDYERIGLCEFHVGLIYLHYGRIQGAAHCFAAAGRQWSFINATASVCLAYFAEGKAQEFSYRYEAALICYNKASQWLDRIQYEPDSRRWRQWVEKLRTEIGGALRKVRRLLRKYPSDQKEETEGEVNGVREDRSGSAALAPSAETGERSGQIVIPPPAPCPLPGHQKMAEDHHWYQVTERTGAFLDFLPQGSWLLVRVSSPHYDKGDLVIVGGEETLTGSITVHSSSHRAPFARIRLARVPLAGPFTREGETVTLRFDSERDRIIQPEAVVGLVVGFWLERQLVQAV